MYEDNGHETEMTDPVALATLIDTLKDGEHRSQLIEKLGTLLSLHDSWSLYVHFKCGNANSYGVSYSCIGSFQTITGFWAHMNSIPSVCNMLTGNVSMCKREVAAYSLFRTGVSPAWEDKVNKDGGEWGCRKHIKSIHWKNIWTSLALACINEEIKKVVGIRMINKSSNAKQMQKLEAWLTTSSTCEAHESLLELQHCLSPLTMKSPLVFSYAQHTQKQEQADTYAARPVAKAVLHQN